MKTTHFKWYGLRDHGRGTEKKIFERKAVIERRMIEIDKIKTMEREESEINVTGPRKLE